MKPRLHKGLELVAKEKCAPDGKMTEAVSVRDSIETINSIQY